MRGVVHTIPEKCRKCYTCVRECPAHAIQIVGGQALIVEDRCISCGNCVRVCSQKAKVFENYTDRVWEMLKDNSHELTAIVAPSFPAFFPNCEPPERLVGALKVLGFEHVMEVAFGADMVAREYKRLYDKLKSPIIATPCPAISFYVIKYLPEIIPNLAPVISPMIAMARAVKEIFAPKSKVVFLGPCVAKKVEAAEPQVAGDVDIVLTFNEIKEMFRKAGIDTSKAMPLPFDGPQPSRGTLFPVSGGLLRSAGIEYDISKNDLLIAEGKDRIVSLLHSFAAGEMEPRFLDLLFCEGCVNGPLAKDREKLFAHRDNVLRYYRERTEEFDEVRWRANMDLVSDIDLSRNFSDDLRTLPTPTESQIQFQLQRMGKTVRADELDCGACGYKTCREHAIAVLQGLAESEMCLPYTVEAHEKAVRDLEESHKQLKEAQKQLIQSEKMAAMGQLAAGVAHEVNNPLGTVLLYSNLMLESFENTDPRREDIEVIVRETDRCRRIVADLLNFARQNKLVLSEVDLQAFLREVVEPFIRDSKNAGVKVEFDFAEMPHINIDSDQMRQVIINIIQNAIEAMGGFGALKISCRKSPDGARAIIEISDSGAGIADDVLPRIFTPFFTTKPIGKGTGLGLAIAYGIVKLHRGNIRATSKLAPEKGAVITVEIPFGLGDTNLIGEMHSQ